MAYEKTTWVDGETEIDANKLNKIEDGIVEASKTGGILAGTIVGYDGDTIPEGYEEVDGLNDYSTEEKVVGKWVDGKPLYRKVIQTTTPSYSGSDVVSYDSTHDVKLFYGTINQSEGAKWSVPCYFNSTINGSMQFNGLTHKINFFGGSATLSQPIEIVYLYTKTTD